MSMNTIAVLFLPVLTIAAAQVAQAQEVRKPTDVPPARHERARANLSTSKLSPAPVTPPPAPSPFAATPSTYAPRYRPSFGRDESRFGRFRPYFLGSGYTAAFAADVVPAADGPRVSTGAQQDASGTLRLDVEPGTAQIYVDGFYVGTVDDFVPHGVTLPAGRHWIDLREASYETLTIPVEVGPGRPARFRGGLAAVPIPTPRAIPPRGSETMYVIPGCYAGNRPPGESALARGCDIARLRVLVLGT
jgi:hypothetical protein